MDSPVGVTVLAGLMAALFLVRSSTTVDEIQPADSVQGGQLPNKMPIASNAHHPPPEGYPRLSFLPCRAGACGGVRGRVCTEAEPGTFGEDHRPMCPLLTLRCSGMFVLAGIQPVVAHHPTLYKPDRCAALPLDVSRGGPRPPHQIKYIPGSVGDELSACQSLAG